MSDNGLKSLTSIISDDIEVHRDINDYLNEVYGEQYPEKNGNVYTGKYRRKGEGKFFKKVLRFHEKQAKRCAQTLSFSPDTIYIFAFKHNRDYEKFGTITSFNWWLSSFRLFFSSDMLSEVQNYVEAIVASMQAREIYRPICLITNVDESFDDIPMINEVYSY